MSLREGRQKTELVRATRLNLSLPLLLSIFEGSSTASPQHGSRSSLLYLLMSRRADRDHSVRHTSLDSFFAFEFSFATSKLTLRLSSLFRLSNIQQVTSRRDRFSLDSRRLAFKECSARRGRREEGGGESVAALSSLSRISVYLSLLPSRHVLS